MQLFISYSRQDSEFADRLARALEQEGFETWMDRTEVAAGDNLLEAINTALRGADGVIIVLSPRFTTSPWLVHELTAAASREYLEGTRLILPVLLEDTEVPVLLRDRFYADFRTSFDQGFQTLLRALKPGKGAKRRLQSEANAQPLSAESTDVQLTAIREELELGNLTVFCGAGISVAAGVPSWSTLLQSLLTELFLRHSTATSPDELAALYQQNFSPSPLMIAQYLKNGLGRDYLTRIRKTLYGSVSKSTPVIDSIVELARPRRNRQSLHSIVTFNFDDLIEHNLQSNAISPRCIYSEGQRARPSEIPVYHVHGFLPREGVLTDAHAVVFSEDAYHSQFIDPFSWSNLVQLQHFSQNLCLFVGISLTDPNMRRLLDVAMRKNPDRGLNHYIFKRRHRDGAETEGGTDVGLAGSATREMLRVAEMLEELDAKNLGLNVIWVQQYDDIPVFLRRLLDT